MIQKVLNDYTIDQNIWSEVGAHVTNWLKAYIVGIFCAVIQELGLMMKIMLSVYKGQLKNDERWQSSWILMMTVGPLHIISDFEVWEIVQGQIMQFMNLASSGTIIFSWMEK